ncbi:SDR family NAD(P)-dependent oxidoreductase [Alteraurantiacibacter aquimixticola]|uniref:SDR family NAD(P)-dependent oxidoreductase n=1 Tax=Alteraurantiacibacter aquimixticola TaxID=2489173 RepID=A0A4T3F7L3_9SPHN|nr:SDR family NAD(P)-dependent oxidoreductase [Alteraurantiacibacter aquimixticola]TIX51712.1 SDR family NAD(P)-dependent oxidoreductase [Alteraurantiacibacter aquimixticola]
MSNQQSQPLAGRVAIVTGAGGGLGRSHAHYLAGKGASVVVNDLSDDSASAVAEEIRAAGGKAMGFAASVTEFEAVEAMVAKARQDLGSVDILVNNAGILRDKSFAKMDLADFRLVIEVHLMGSTNCCKAVWETMRQQAYGRIVMTSSSSGLFGNFGQANYGAAKMAVVGLMQTLAIEGAKYNIRVNSLAPTAATPMTKGLMVDGALAALDPALVSPGLLALVGEDAPTRAIMCAGAGNFAASHVTLTEGFYAGGGEDAGAQVVANWDRVMDRTGEIVPEYGFKQAECELERAGFTGPIFERG